MLVLMLVRLRGGRGPGVRVSLVVRRSVESLGSFNLHSSFTIQDSHKPVNTTVEFSLNDDEMQSAVYTASVDTSPTSADDGRGGTSRTEYRGKWVRTGDFSFSAGAFRCSEHVYTAMERGVLRRFCGPLETRVCCWSQTSAPAASRWRSCARGVLTTSIWLSCRRRKGACFRLVQRWSSLLGHFESPRRIVRSLTQTNRKAQKCATTWWPVSSYTCLVSFAARQISTQQFVRTRCTLSLTLGHTTWRPVVYSIVWLRP